MKAKKALKRLNKIESLLSDVIGGLSKDLNGTGEILESAKESILHVKTELESKSSASAAKKSPTNAGARPGAHGTHGKQKKISFAAKKRSAAAKRKGMHPAKNRALQKSA